MIQIFFNILATLFMGFMCYRWGTRSSLDSMIKVTLFLVFTLGFLIIYTELKQY